MFIIAKYSAKNIEWNNPKDESNTVTHKKEYLLDLNIVIVLNIKNNTANMLCSNK